MTRERKRVRERKERYFSKSSDYKFLALFSHSSSIVCGSVICLRLFTIALLILCFVRSVIVLRDFFRSLSYFILDFHFNSIRRTGVQLLCRAFSRLSSLVNYAISLLALVSHGEKFIINGIGIYYSQYARLRNPHPCKTRKFVSRCDVRKLSKRLCEVRRFTVYKTEIQCVPLAARIFSVRIREFSL